VTGGLKVKVELELGIWAWESEGSCLTRIRTVSRFVSALITVTDGGTEQLEGGSLELLLNKC